MFDSLIAWFDARYSPVALATDTRPPMGLRAFVLYFVRQFRSSPESRYVGTALRVGRSSGIAEAQAVGPDGKVAILARLTAYR